LSLLERGPVTDFSPWPPFFVRTGSRAVRLVPPAPLRSHVFAAFAPPVIAWEAGLEL